LLPESAELRRGPRRRDRRADGSDARRTALRIIRQDRERSSRLRRATAAATKATKFTKNTKNTKTYSVFLRGLCGLCDLCGRSRGPWQRSGSAKNPRRSPANQDQPAQHRHGVLVAIGRGREVIADHDERGRDREEGVVLRA